MYLLLKIVFVKSIIHPFFYLKANILNLHVLSECTRATKLVHSE